MKKTIFIFLLVLSALPGIAKHVTGGEVIYDYLGPGNLPNSKKYNVTLRLFRDFYSGGAPLASSLTMGVFNNDNNALINGYQVVPQVATLDVPTFTPPNCISNSPQLKYTQGVYTFEIELLDNVKGYTITYQTCCRVDGIGNTADGVGSTYSGIIPGSNTLPTGNDNSARFQTGINIICNGKPFVLDFSATDPDADFLEYSFVNAYDGGPAVGSSCSGCPAAFANPIAPPYQSIPYIGGYSDIQPLGPLATINSATGIISGIAPSLGSKFVVCVMVKSFRNGVFIAEHRKDFIITVAPCDLAGSELNPTYTNCDNFDFVFNNNNNSLLNTSFNWDFGDPGSGASNFSTLEIAPHTFSAAGTYTIKLTVNRGTPCADSAISIVNVYPGFFPNIAPIQPQCRNVPLAFSENGTTNYGTINYWKWDFGITNLSNDTSRLQVPSYSYPDAGNYTTTLIVKNSKGCIDTLTVPVTITENANLIISRDTLICAVDTLQLRSNFTTGNITWSPNYNINSVNSFNPLVSPDVTTTYTATYLSPSGCSAVKTVTIKVVIDVTLLSLNDTTICRTDTARINTNTDALYFSWTPTNVILNPTVRNPLVFPTAPSTIFRVKASISNKCFKEADVRVTTVPYPLANITGVNTICYGENVQLTATGGSTYLWTPNTFLNNANIPNPISIRPTTSITYKVQVNDNLGCPKPAFKTFSLTVVKVSVDAGPADTSIVRDQLLQLNATTVNGTTFSWTPPTSLTATNIFNPISNTLDDIIYTVAVGNGIGCTALDSIRVKVFNVPPDLYVPSAFSPDADGVNDVIRPIALGIKKLENFSVYNRFGELLFKTANIGKGWDGTYKGEKQIPGTYVWQASAIDYKDRKIFKKGSVILIR